MIYISKLNFALLLSHFLVNLGTRNIGKVDSIAVFSTPMNMRWLNFSFQPNTNVEATLGHEHWINVTLFCQRWNNVNKCQSDQLSFSTKYQRWNNVNGRWRSTLFQRWCICWDFIKKLTSFSIFSKKLLLFKDIIFQ